jgi:hypothetical protein
MINYFFGFLLAIASVSCKSQKVVQEAPQHTTVLYLPTYYREAGIIFHKEYAAGIEMKDLQYRYTPSKEDIMQTERIFQQQYHIVEKKSLDTKVYFDKWVRQYVGLVDKEGNKNIIVQLVNNTDRKKIDKLLGKDWRNTFIVMLSDSFYQVSTRFRINLDKNEMSTNL